MSNFNAPQTAVTPALPLVGSTALLGIDTNLAAGAQPQQGAISLAQLDAVAQTTITYAATITPDRSLGASFACTLTGNVTIANPTNPFAGQNLRIKLIQDASGSRLGTWGNAFKFVGGSKTLTTTAAAIDVASGYYDGTNWLMALNKAYA